MSFFEKLEQRVEASGSLLCIGLDPHLKDCPSVEEALAFCIDIIEQTHPYAACFKPNCAFFEQHGQEGTRALIEVIEKIPEDIPVILDCKRGDIDTTAQAYARSAYEVLSPRASSATAVTLSPYMGWDSVRDCQRVDMFIFRGLLLYTAAVIFPIDCCIRRPRASSIILYDSINIAQHHHTNNNPSINIFQPLNQHQ
tara:strand:- start:190 stop:780 length:591 start_codon:yes stop_codon:yes gene_type:complete